MSDDLWVFASGALESASASSSRRTDALKRIGPFAVEGELGRGGMGQVLRVRFRGAPYALKLILRDRARVRERLTREAQVVGALEHPGIVALRGAGAVEGSPFLLYDLVPGARPLSAAWTEYSVPRRVRLVAQVADAIGYAHGCGVVHRDLKPDNVLVDENGQPRVIDFGLARQEGMDRFTQTGAWLGTPSYMAPEQFAAERALQTPAVDVWSLGVILYEALTDRLPFQGHSALELATRVQDRTPPPPSRESSEVSRELDAVCMRALAKSPAARFADAQEFARELRLALMAPPRARAPRWAWAVGALVALGLVGAGVWRLGAAQATPVTVTTPGEGSASTPRDFSEPKRLIAEHGEAWLLAEVDSRLVEAPDDVEARLAKALVLQRREASEEGLAMVSTVLERDPDNLFAHEIKAGCLYRMGRMDEARAACERGLALDSGSSSLWVILSLIASGLDQAEESLEAAKQAVRLSPNSGHARSARGMARQLTGDLEGALADYDYAIGQDDNRHTRFNRAHLKFGQKRYAEALIDYEEAIAKGDATDPNARFGRVQCLIELDPAAAVEAAAGVCHDHPQLQESHYLQGNALRAADQSAQAAESYRRARDLDPNSPVGREAQRLLETLYGESR